jgi:hypothetical protein
MNGNRRDGRAGPTLDLQRFDDERELVHLTCGKSVQPEVFQQVDSVDGRPSSNTPPVRINRAARKTDCAVMWLPSPRWSPLPHFDGQRAPSAGACQDWPYTMPPEKLTASKITVVMPQILVPFGE